MTCEMCGLGKTAQFNCVMGQGPSPCKVMIVGEAPAWRKERDKPFQGEAGKILDDILTKLGVSRQDVYITNIVKCRPPENRKPHRSEIAICKKLLKQEIREVNPDYVLLLGASAASLIYGGKIRVGDIRGKFYTGKRTYLVSIHPGAVLRDPRKLPLLRNDIRRFMDRVHGVVTNGVPVNWKIITNFEDFNQLFEAVKSAERVAIDIETTGLNPWLGEILTIGFGFKDVQYILPLQHKESPYKDNKEGQMMLLGILKPWLINKAILTHNGKFDTLWIKVHYDLTLPIAHDTMLMSHLLDENDKHGLKYLSQIVFGAPNYDLSVTEKTGGATLATLAQYNAQDVYYTRALYNIYIEQLKQNPALYKFYKKVIIPAVNAFRDIEFHGVYIAKDRLLETKMQLEIEVATLLVQLNDYKKGVNWNSTQQLAEFLFKDLCLNPLDKTPGGANSTSESVLKRLEHPAVDLILKYRESFKMLGTFIQSWIEKEEDSRLHPTFKLHGTVTGRLSCEDPNLQQVPRDPKIRSLVTAPPGFTFVEADFAQVELRIAAMMSGDPAMLEAFLTGTDIHTKTAQAISGKDLSTMGGFDAKEWRKKAKAINFGFLYGMGPKKFKEYARDKYQVNFTLEESNKIRDRFFATYSGLQPWYKRMERIARMNGEVKSLSGRVRHLPTINSPDEFEQSQAIRQAINSPVQGFASDLTLMSVVDIVRLMPEVIIVGTVHDSILMEIPDDKVDKLVPIIQEVMENPPTLRELGVQLSLPIKVEVKRGSWGS